MKKGKKKQAPHSALTLTEGEQLLGWVYLAVEMLVLPSAIALLGSNFGGFSPGISNFLYYLTNAVCCAVIFRALLVRSLLRAGDGFADLLSAALIGLLLLLGANQITGALAELLVPDFVNANNAAISAMVAQHPFLLSFALVALVPVGEECLFRGLMFAGWYQRNRMGAYVLSVVGFAVVHVSAYLGSTDPLSLFLAFLQYVPAGIILAWSFERSGSLFAPILIHAAVNAGSILALR